jgi:hypothetical protein
MEHWEKSYYITAISGANIGSSLVVMSKGMTACYYLCVLLVTSDNSYISDGDPSVSCGIEFTYLILQHCLLMARASYNIICLNVSLLQEHLTLSKRTRLANNSHTSGSVKSGMKVFT